MARKEIGVPLDRENRNNHNDNYKELYNNLNNVVKKIKEELYDEIIDSSILNWRSPVDEFSDLPTDAEEGDTVMVIGENTVYRFSGEEWIDIQRIDLDAFDSFLTVDNEDWVV